MWLSEVLVRSGVEAGRVGRVALAELQRRVGELFGRPEPRRQAGLYLEGARPSARTAGSWPKRSGTLAHPAGSVACLVGPGQGARPVSRLCGRAPGGAGRRADHRRDRVLEEGNPVGRRGAPVFRDGGSRTARSVFSWPMPVQRVMP